MEIDFLPISLPSSRIFVILYSFGKNSIFQQQFSVSGDLLPPPAGTPAHTLSGMLLYVQICRRN